jgi:hypothetical protein
MGERMWKALVWAAPAIDLAVMAVTNQGGAMTDAACDQAVVALMADRSGKK